MLSCPLLLAQRAQASAFFQPGSSLMTFLQSLLIPTLAFMLGALTIGWVIWLFSKAIPHVSPEAPIAASQGISP
jgi:hypothetical protein